MLKIKTRLKKKFSNRVGECKPIFDDLIELIEEDYQSVLSQILDVPKEVSNWEHQTAVLVGEARSYRKLISLLNISGDN